MAAANCAECEGVRLTRAQHRYRIVDRGRSDRGGIYQRAAGGVDRRGVGDAHDADARPVDLSERPDPGRPLSPCRCFRRGNRPVRIPVASCAPHRPA